MNKVKDIIFLISVIVLTVLAFSYCAVTLPKAAAGLTKILMGV